MSGATVIALAGLLGYAEGLRRLGSLGPEFVPMAPSTAACFLILSAAVLGHDRSGWTGFSRALMMSLVGVVIVFGLFTIIGALTGLDLTGEARLAAGMGTVRGIPIGRMSPATAFAFLAAATGALLLCLRTHARREPRPPAHVASSLGALTVLLGATVLLGYLLGTPLMYGSGAVPMAATTALAFLSLGTALAAAAGGASFPVRLIVGDTLSAVLSRVFFTLTVSSLLVQGVLTRLVSRPVPSNDVLMIASLIVVTCSIAALAVAGVSHRFGARLDERMRTLRLSEERLHLSTAAAKAAVWDWNLKTNEMIWDDRMFELYGLTHENFPGGIEAWQKGLHPDDAARAIAECDAAVRGEKEFDTEFRVLRPDGTIVNVKAAGLVVRGADGTPLRMTGVNSNVTELRRDDLERQSMQEIARSVASSANLDELLAGMHGALRRVLRAENCYVALYDGASGLFSFPYFVDQNDEVPEPVAMPTSCTAYVLRRGEPALITPGVFRELQAQGEVEQVGTPAPTWMGVPLRTPSGIIGILVVQDYEREDAYDVRDLRFLASVAGQVALVIERRLGVAALRDSETELSTVVESMADGLLVVSNTGKVLRSNRRFAEMWRIPDSIMASQDDVQLLGHVVSQLVDPAAFIANVQALYHSTESTRDRILFADGRVFVRTSVPLIKEGANVGRLWSFHDITNRVRVEDEKAALETQLHHAEKLESVGRLAGGVAHDFNNMLAVILGYVELALQRVPPSEPLHADLAQIQMAARHSADVTAQLLAYARKQTLQPVTLDINERVATLLSMLQPLIGENIEVQWQPAADLWPVKMDPSQLVTVLTNLCTNARDAIAGVGTITLATANCVVDAATVAAYPEAEPGEHVRLTVRDTGRGMEASTLAMVFEPFFTTKEVGAGTGLGLASVHGAVKQNGGFIMVTSVVGEGTSFEVFFPRHVDETGSASRSMGSGEPATMEERILLVEDELAILKLTTRVLEGQGYVVIPASSPGEALRIARKYSGKIHLLLSDVTMPEMNGRQLAAELLKLRPTLRQLFMSGHAAEVIADAGMLEPGAAFIAKPCSNAALAAKVREVLDRA